MMGLNNITVSLVFLVGFDLGGFAQSSTITTYTDLGRALADSSAPAATQAIGFPSSVSPDATGGFYFASSELLKPGLVPSELSPGVGTRLLIPSSVYSDQFVSSLVILNMDSQPNNVTIQASKHLGDSIGSMEITLQVGECFRTLNILGDLGAEPGSFGPILVSSNNGRLLLAMSEVVSPNRGSGGVLTAVNPDLAWTQGILLEATDFGSRGMFGTQRTNLGLINTSDSSGTDVTMTLFNSSGQQVGTPLTVPIAGDCPTVCSEQIDTIVQRLRGSEGLTEGYVRISSRQPIIAWASKIENGTDDPGFQVGVPFSDEVRSDLGTQLLVPSAVYSDAFTSSLVVSNLGSQPNSVRVTAFDSGGNPLAPPWVTTLPVGGQFRSSNILQQLGAVFGSFGPIRVESTNDGLLAAVSEVRNRQGFGGFFPAVNVQAAWDQGFILDVMESGARGTVGTYRTNLGLNSIGSGVANISVTLFRDSGQQVGDSLLTTVPANGLTQLDHIVQQLRGSAATITGGYLRIVSTQPIIAWASKVENGTDDPSIQLGLGVSFAATQGATLVDLNGTYLSPSSGTSCLTVYDGACIEAIASATTDPLGDRRGEGQVYELNKGSQVPDGTYTPFSDEGHRPRALSGVDLRGKGFQCDVDLHDLNLWNDGEGYGAEFFQIGTGRQADPTDNGTEEVFVFIYKYGAGFAIYMETDWALYRPETTYLAAADETKFHLRVEVNAAATEALLKVTPLNGLGAGIVHTVNPLPLDLTIDNVTHASFFAGFTQNISNVNSTAKATISRFVTVPNVANQP